MIGCYVGYIRRTPCKGLWIKKAMTYYIQSHKVWRHHQYLLHNTIILWRTACWKGWCIRNQFFHCSISYPFLQRGLIISTGTTTKATLILLRLRDSWLINPRIQWLLLFSTNSPHKPRLFSNRKVSETGFLGRRRIKFKGWIGTLMIRCKLIMQEWKIVRFKYSRTARCYELARVYSINYY